MTKFLSANFLNISSPRYTILRIQRLEGKQCRSMLFAKSAIFISGTEKSYEPCMIDIQIDLTPYVLNLN